MNPTRQKAPRTGALARSAITGLAGARVGVARVRQKLQSDTSHEARQRHEEDVGRILLGAMTQLRGTALKVAQVLSLDAPFLPAGVRAQLAQATHQVAPLNRALVGRVFRQAFGCEPEAMFQHFEPTAFAAASLGQVHRATLPDGTAVAVKLQYPGIAATIETDLRLLEQALKRIGPSLATLPSPAVLDRLLQDIRTQLLEEVDYEQEAQQQRWFKQHTLHPSGTTAAQAGSSLAIADVWASHSGKTVLTQSLLPGLHLDDWLATAPDQATRNRQGQAVWDWFMRCALQHGRIHGDLHPGNFLFTPDGVNGTGGVLDFGCTRALSPAFCSRLAQSWCAWLSQAAPAAALLRTYRALGVVAPETTQARFESELLPAIAPVLDWATEPFRADGFDFSSKSLPPLPQPGVQHQAARHAGFVPPELLSLDRAWLGLMHLLRRLGAQVDTREARALLAQAAGTMAATPD